MSQSNSKEIRYGAFHDCGAWRLFLAENWGTTEGISYKQRRIELIRQWANSEQEFRDKFIERTKDQEKLERDESNQQDYYGDASPDEIRILNALGMYPCIRTNFSSKEDEGWKKIELFLKLDENLSPLHEEELPPIIQNEEFKNLDLDDYARKFIFDNANFKLMGMSGTGHPVYYYHILMLADERSFDDGTLLHVDFDRNGKPGLKIRYPAIDSYLPWTKHMNQRYNLQLIESNFLHPQNNNRIAAHRFDLQRPAITLLRDEMESREVNIEDMNDLGQLAFEAVSTVNPGLLTST